MIIVAVYHSSKVSYFSVRCSVCHGKCSVIKSSSTYMYYMHMQCMCVLLCLHIPSFTIISCTLIIIMLSLMISALMHWLESNPESVPTRPLPSVFMPVFSLFQGFIVFQTSAPNFMKWSWSAIFPCCVLIKFHPTSLSSCMEDYNGFICGFRFQFTPWLSEIPSGSMHILRCTAIRVSDWSLFIYRYLIWLNIITRM